jgi:hypothetical protein
LCAILTSAPFAPIELISWICCYRIGYWMLSSQDWGERIGRSPRRSHKWWVFLASLDFIGALLKILDPLLCR